MKNDQAFPTKNELGYGEGGLTKREYFAAKVLAALCTDPAMKVTYAEVAKKTGKEVNRVIAGAAVYYADALIEELEKK